MECVEVREVQGSMTLLERELHDVKLAPIKDGSGHPGINHNGGWIQGLAMARLFNTRPDGSMSTTQLMDLPYTARIVRTLQYQVMGRVRQIMLNRLAPLSWLDKHSDGPPKHRRFHLPIYTTPLAVWWDEINGEMQMERGFWYGPVPYCGVLHSMANRDPDYYRVHLIVDLDCPTERLK